MRKVESGLKHRSTSRDEESWSKFFDWTNTELSQQLGTKVNLDEVLSILNSGISSNNIKPSECQTASQDYSLYAKKPFKKGDIVFDIHRCLMMTSETALRDANLGEFIRKDSIASAMPNVILVLHFLNEFSKGETSFWYPYLNIMPNNILPTFQLGKEGFKNLLSSAHIFDALKMIRAIARQYSYFFKRLESTKLPLAKDFTFDYYCWGVSIVCSRQNEIPPSDRQLCPLPVVNALIPILDMCNHNPDSNQAIFEDNNSILYASKDISAGSEITINYGTRTSGEYYIHNGFVPDVVKFDVMPFNVDLNKQDRLFELKAKLLKLLNMPSSGRFKLVDNLTESRHRRDPHLTMFLIAYFLSEEELDIILKSDNPVGISDYIYEHVQYNNNSSNKDQSSNLNSDYSSKPEIEAMAERLSKKVQDYMCKRASVSIAIIDRTIQDGVADSNLLKLLQHERNMYQSYLINIEN